jgi:small subunit ribosomal protein S6
MRDYELMLILDPTLDDDTLNGAAERIQALVTARGGEMTALDPMGRRRMAYPIKQHRDGYYTVARFKMAPAAANELDRGLKLNDQVIRHLLINKD